MPDFVTMIQLFERIPQPTGTLLLLSGLWALLIDRRENYLRQRYRDAAFSRIAGWVYVILGVTISITRRLIA